MSLLLSSLIMAGPAISMPITNRADCRNAPNQNSCKKCVSMRKAYMPNGICRPMAQPHERGLANRGQCSTQKGGMRGQCERCVQRKFRHQFFPAASPGTRCRYVKGSRAKKVPRTSPAPGLAAPLGMPAVNMRACQTAKNPRGCQNCVRKQKAYFPNGSCQAMVKANEGGMRSDSQCDGIKGLGRNQCKRCVNRNYPYRYFPNAGVGMRCRYVKGGRPRPPKGKPSPSAVTMPIVAAHACGGSKNPARCKQCTSKQRAFFPNGSCRTMVKANEGGLRNQGQCSNQGARRAQCTACVSRNYPHRYFPNAGPGMRCRYLRGGRPRATSPAPNLKPAAQQPILTRPGCNRFQGAKQKLCNRCMNRRDHAFFQQGGRCLATVKPNEGGLRRPRQCDRAAMNRVKTRLCNQCVSEPNRRFFQHASGSMQCRWVKGGQTARPTPPPAQRVATKPDDLLRSQSQCASLPKMWVKHCNRCFNKAGKDRFGFVKRGSSSDSCGALVASNAGGIRKPGPCQSLSNPVKRRSCLRCVNKQSWPGAFFPASERRLQCRHIVPAKAPKGLRFKPAIQHKMPRP